MAQSDGQRYRVLRALLIVLVGQVGCLTLLIVLASVLIGLWLDSNFHTKPLFTLVLLLAGVPVSVLIMLVVARRTLSRLMRDEDAMKKKDPDDKEVS